MTSRNQGTLGCREEVPGTRLIIFHIGLSCFRASIGINRPNPQCHTHGEYCNGKLEETKLRKGHRTVGVNVIYFPIFRQAQPDFFSESGRADEIGSLSNHDERDDVDVRAVRRQKKLLANQTPSLSSRDTLS